MKFEWDDIIKGCINNGVVTLKCAPAVFQNVIYSLLLFAGIGALIFIILGGFKYITSLGDPKQIDEGKRIIIYAIVGLLVILFAFFIISFIGTFTGTKCITLFGFENCKATP